MLNIWLYIFIGIIIFGFLLFTFLPKSGLSKSVKLTPQQCEENAKKYDGKVLKINGDGILGKAEVVGNSKDCRLEVYYVFYFNSNLSANPYDNMTWKYNYTGLMKKDSIKDRKYYRSTGTITIVEANAGKLPDSAKNFQATSLFYRPKSTNAWNTLETTHFYNTFSLFQDLTDDGYQDIFKYNWFGVVDLKPYINKVSTGGNAFEYKTDTDGAELNGNIVNEFNFKVTE